MLQNLRQVCLAAHEREQRPAMALADLPALSITWTASGRSSSRSVLATAGAALAHPLGDLLLCQTKIVDEGPIAARCLQGVEVISLQVLNHCYLQGLESSASWTSDGMVRSPARRAARHRLSPATIW